VSLRTRMAIAVGLAVAIAVLGVAIAAYAGMRSQLRGQVDDALKDLCTQVPDLPSGSCPAGSRVAPAPGPPFGSRGSFAGPSEPVGVQDEGLGLDRLQGPGFGGAPGSYLVVYRDGGHWPVNPQIPVTSTLRALAAAGSGQHFLDMTVRSTHIRVLVVGLGDRGALAIALPLTDVDSALSSALLLLAIIAAAGIGLAALLGVFVARTALAPIERFTQRTEAIASEPDRMIESERLEVPAAGELARLARTFNATLDALEQAVRSQRNLVADASHELRTPIATIRANLQLMRDEQRLSAEDREALRADVIDELDELTALVSDVVELARGSKAVQERGEVRLDGIVSAELDRARRRAPELEFRASIEPTLLLGEGGRIARAVSNLLDNARKWSPPHAVVEVTLHDGVLTVRDHGPGFHPEDLPFVFDRFHRAKDARAKPGSGLGLAIVRQAAEAHAGFVEASNAPSGGAVLRVGFGRPIAPADPEPQAAFSEG
jgi:two-component system, OmpR family, sensor histidine kinase MprB